MTETKTLSDCEFVLEHIFKAPAAKVFAAYTDPKMVPLWWAPKGGSVRVESMDVKPGGSWRYIQRNPNGSEMAFSGKYVEVKPVTRLVYTFITEGQPNEIRATVELSESGGTTKLRLTNLCSSKEARDAMVQYGAAAGAKAAWDRLAAVLGVA
jgi:uncharacterized protein YndB with AHSA1/START domain